MLNWFLAKMQKRLKEVKIAFEMNGAETIGYPLIKNK